MNHVVRPSHRQLPGAQTWFPRKPQHNVLCTGSQTVHNQSLWTTPNVAPTLSILTRGRLLREEHKVDSGTVLPVVSTENLTYFSIALLQSQFVTWLLQFGLLVYYKVAFVQFYGGKAKCVFFLKCFLFFTKNIFLVRHGQWDNKTCMYVTFFQRTSEKSPWPILKGNGRGSEMAPNNVYLQSSLLRSLLKQFHMTVIKICTVREPGAMGSKENLSRLVSCWFLTSGHRDAHSSEFLK